MASARGGQEHSIKMGFRPKAGTKTRKYGIGTPMGWPGKAELLVARLASKEAEEAAWPGMPGQRVE